MNEELEYTKRCTNCAWFAVIDGTCCHNPRKQPRPTEASNLACSNYKPIMCEQYNKRAEDVTMEEWDNCPHAGESSAACNLCRTTPPFCEHGMYPYCPLCDFGYVYQEESWPDENYEWICTLGHRSEEE